MTKKALKEVQKRLFDLRVSHHDNSYDDLWTAIDTLVNLGLLDKSYKDLIVKTDKELFYE